MKPAVVTASQYPPTQGSGAKLVRLMEHLTERHQVHIFNIGLRAKAEVMVKKDDPLNAQEVYLDGFMYVGDSGNIELPLYFAPEFTQKCVGKVKMVQERGIQYVGRVIRVLPTTSGQLKRDPEKQ